MGAGGIDINRTTARLSSSLSRYEPKMSDVAFKSSPLFEHLNKNSETQNGGLEMAIRFEYAMQPGLGDAGGVNTFSYYDDLTLTPDNSVKTGTEPYKNINSPVVLSWEETRENVAPNGFDRLKHNTNNSMKSIRDQMGLVAWGISGGNTDALPVSVPKLVSGAGLGSGYTVHGLAKSSNTWMYSQEQGAIGEFADFGVQRWRTIWNSCCANSPDDDDAPTLVMTDQVVFEAYEDVLPPQYRTDSLAKGDIGFQQLYFKGAPVRFDRRCPLDPDGNRWAFFLNNKYMKLKYDSEGKFKTFPMVWMGPRNLMWATQIVFRGGVICTNFASQGVGYGMTVNT